MDDREKARINRRYDERLDRFGDDIRTLASGTDERRRLRFQVLTEIGLRNGCTVLDLGCGFGDFLGYIRDRGLEVDYTGYDINPRLIEIARRRYPGATFDVVDIQEQEFPTFDYIVSSSAFNLPLETRDNYEFLADILRACYGHAREGVALDLLSSYVDFEGDAFHYSPEQVFAIGKSLTRRVMLRHDYPLFEFCLYLFPDFEGWRQPGARQR
jgi:SAM-dependent methyltransferase